MHGAIVIVLCTGAVALVAPLNDWKHRHDFYDSYDFDSYDFYASALEDLIRSSQAAAVSLPLKSI